MLSDLLVVFRRADGPNVREEDPVTVTMKAIDLRMLQSLLLAAINEAKEAGQ